MVLFARRGSAIVGLCALTSALVSIGCSSIPTFPARPRDAGTQCSDTMSCPSGQSCLQGLCYAACDMTHPCGPREMCQSGVCVARSTDAGGPPHDVGMDGGPCSRLTCAAPTAQCRADLAMCVECTSTMMTCGGATAVCDVGRGTCTAFAATVCAACNTNADCPSAMTCVTRSAPDPVERVCLPACGAGCMPGLTCADGTHCTPFIGSCTAYLAAVNGRPCTSDAQCPQLGATVDDGLVTGMCFGPAAGGPMTCHAACGGTPDCVGGRVCGAPPGGGMIHFCQ